MERTYLIPVDGMAVVQSDLNEMGASAGRADDAVLREFLKIPAYDGSTVTKAIVAGVNPLFAPNGVRTVTVGSFRALIGSRTVVGTDAELNLKDIRSGLYLGGDVVLAANTSGFTRFDLIEAVVTIDTPESTVVRKVKDLTTGIVTATNTHPILVTTVTLQVVQGTPSGTPVFPSATADSGSTYYVPIGYVRCGSGFTTIATNDIDLAFKPLPVSATMGTINVRPSTSNMNGGAGVSGTGTSINGDQRWSATPGNRPATFLPPTLAGGESLLVALDLTDTNPSNWSHSHLDTIDDSTDWRNRLWKFNAVVGYGSTTLGSGHFPWTDVSGSTPSGTVAGYAAGGNEGRTWVPGMGDSFDQGVDPYVMILQAGGSSGVATPATGANVPTEVMPSGTEVALRVDRSTGKLYLFISGTPRVRVIAWLEASGQYS